MLVLLAVGPPLPLWAVGLATFAGCASTPVARSTPPRLLFALTPSSRHGKGMNQAKGESRRYASRARIGILAPRIIQAQEVRF